MKKIEINNLSELIDYIKSIPKDKWCITKTTDNFGNHCFLGHCDKIFQREKAWDLTQNIWDLVNYDTNTEKFKDIFCMGTGISHGNPLACINDGYVNEYQQDNPKDRILAVLNDLLNLELLLQEANELKNRELVEVR